MRLAISNLVFATLSTVTLCAVGFTSFALSFGLPVSEQIGANQEYSELEGRARQSLPELTFESIVSKTYQSSFDQCLSDHIPYRDALMLGNAALQRFEINVANLAFGWPAYPTNLESKYCVVPARNTIIGKARSPSKKLTNTAKAWASAIARTAESHPNARFVYDVLDDTYSSPANPTHNLISNPYSEEWVRKHVISNLGDRVQTIFDPIASEDELYT